MTASRIILIPKVASAGGGATGLDDLTDVTITAAASGDILRHNGTAWVDTPGATHFEAAGAVSTHAAVTTNVHGITDTSALETTTGAASKVSTHAALTSSVHGISAFGATLVDDADAATARTTLGVDYTTLDERTRDTIGTALTAGTGITITPNDGADTITFALDTTGEAERIRDTIGACLVAGSNVTITVNDAGDTITIASTGGGGGVTMPWASSGGQAYYSGLPGWVLVGSGGYAGALSPFDVYTLPIFVPEAITVTGWDCFVGAGNEAGKVLRVGIFAGSGTKDSWLVGSLENDLGTVSVATANGKTVTGLSASVAAGWHQLALVTNAAALNLYGYQAFPEQGGSYVASNGNNSAGTHVRWWYDYNGTPDYAASGLPSALSGFSQGALGTTNDIARIPISLRWTNP